MFLYCPTVKYYKNKDTRIALEVVSIYVWLLFFKSMVMDTGIDAFRQTA